MKQITIDDLIPLLKKGWVACNSRGMWRYFTKKPRASSRGWWIAEYGDNGCSDYLFMFNIAPFKGEWQDSLMRSGETKRKLTRKDIEKIMQSPKYWRDQDPESLKIVSDWFDKQGV